MRSSTRSSRTWRAATKSPAAEGARRSPRRHPLRTREAATAPPTTPTAGTDTAFTGSIATGATTGTAIQDVTVSWGDGETKDLGPAAGTAIGLHHVYASGGTFTVTLTGSPTCVVAPFG